MNKLSSFCQRLHYSFHNEQLLKQALTHRSLNTDNNERLEFLGDSVLNLAISALLFERFPAEPEGVLSRLRAVLVKEESVAEVATAIQIGEVLQLSASEKRTGGQRRVSILADALEAILGAIYLDGGWSAVSQVVTTLFHEKLRAPDLSAQMIDHKSALQEWLQAQKKALPVYTLLKTTGKGHQQMFHVSCEVPHVVGTGIGKGMTRRKAEQEAAYQLLSHMKHLSRGA